MSLAALNVSGGIARPSLEHSREMVPNSADGGIFDSIMNTLTGGKQPNAHGAALNDAASAKDQESPGESTSKSKSQESIDPGLAGLVFDALGSPRRPARGSAADASSASVSVASASLTIPAALAAAQAIQPAISDAALGSAAATLTSAGVAAAGALDAPQAIRRLTLSDPALGLTSLQTRTFLAVDNAGQTEAKDPFLRSPTLVAASAAVLEAAGAAPPGASEAATGRRASSSQSGTLAPQSVANAERLASGAVASPGSTQNDASFEKRSGSGGKDSQAAASAGQAAPTPAAASVSLAASSPAFVSIGPIGTGELAETLATAAQELVSQTAGATDPTSAATNIAAAQPVKELEIQLDPTDLGAVSVKMRLSGGKLSVVMEIAKPTTLQAVEGERGAITDRLGSAAQPLESLVIRPATTSSANAESNNATDQKSGGGTDGRSDANGNLQGGGRQASPRDPPAQENRQVPTHSPVSGRGFGGMVV
jgi:chemotaxis protein MotD